jgi:hypothetical protein
MHADSVNRQSNTWRVRWREGGKLWPRVVSTKGEARDLLTTGSGLSDPYIAPIIPA